MPSLAVKYRPKTFEEICGQKSIVKILQKQIDLKEFKNVYLFCGSSGCVDAETEYFNGFGWKPISEYEKGENVLIYHKDGTASLEIPERYIKDRCEKMTHITTKYGVDMCLSDEHRIIYDYHRPDRGHIHELREITCSDLKNIKDKNKIGIRTTFNYSGPGIDLTDEEIRVMVMVMADGSFIKDRPNSNKCSVSLKKEYKIERARKLLTDANIPFTEHSKNTVDRTVFYFESPRREKYYSSYWYNCTNEQMKIICDECMNWDGDHLNRNCYRSEVKESLDFIQFCFASSTNNTARILYSDIPKKSKIINNKEYKYPEKLHHPCRVNITNGRNCTNVLKLSDSDSNYVEITPKNLTKYCFTVSTGMWIMRRNGCISITGNCGKTTTARAFANAINNGEGTPIEIDGASNRGIDNVRAIINEAKERSIDSLYKIFIVDEAHQISNEAWQAFLKCIEEPPEYTIFIFCTTDPQKLLPTIQNRCMRFNFGRISSNEIYNRLCYICKNENFKNYSDICDYISKNCKNQMRDAISMLEKVASYDTDINIENALFALGNYPYEKYFQLINLIIDHNIEALTVVDEYYSLGGDIKSFVDQLLSIVIDTAKYCLLKNMDILNIPNNFKNVLDYTINIDNADKYFYWLTERLLSLKNMIKNDSNPKDTFEAFIIECIK